MSGSKGLRTGSLSTPRIGSTTSCWSGWELIARAIHLPPAPIPGLDGLEDVTEIAPQLVAIAFGIIMIGAILLKLTRFKTGFFSQTTTGWEFDLVLLAAAVLLLLIGPGEFALQS